MQRQEMPRVETAAVCQMTRRTDQIIANMSDSVRAANSAVLGISAPITETATPEPKAPRKRKGPNKTEALYLDTHLHGRDARYEGMSFLMANGHRYTPDFAVHGAVTELHEVKGSYRLHSHGRARLAFDQARTELPWYTWVWAEKRKGGGFRIERYEAKGGKG